MKSGSEETRTQAPGIGDGQESLACYSPWDGKESDTTEQLKRTEFIFQLVFPKERDPI